MAVKRDRGHEVTSASSSAGWNAVLSEAPAGQGHRGALSGGAARPGRTVPGHGDGDGRSGACSPSCGSCVAGQAVQAPWTIWSAADRCSTVSPVAANVRVTWAELYTQRIFIGVSAVLRKACSIPAVT